MPGPSLTLTAPPPGMPRACDISVSSFHLPVPQFLISFLFLLPQPSQPASPSPLAAAAPIRRRAQPARPRLIRQHPTLQQSLEPRPLRPTATTRAKNPRGLVKPFPGLILTFLLPVDPVGEVILFGERVWPRRSRRRPVHSCVVAV